MLMAVLGGRTCVFSPRVRLWEWKPVVFGMKTMEPYRRRVSYLFALVDILGSEAGSDEGAGPYHDSKASFQIREAFFVLPIC